MAHIRQGKRQAIVRSALDEARTLGYAHDEIAEAFEDELAARGLSDNVDIRYFDQNMHMKTALIDDEESEES